MIKQALAAMAIGGALISAPAAHADTYMVCSGSTCAAADDRGDIAVARVSWIEEADGVTYSCYYRDNQGHVWCDPIAVDH